MIRGVVESAQVFSKTCVDLSPCVGRVRSFFHIVHGTDNDKGQWEKATVIGHLPNDKRGIDVGIRLTLPGLRQCN